MKWHVCLQCKKEINPKLHPRAVKFCCLTCNQAWWNDKWRKKPKKKSWVFYDVKVRKR